MIRSANPVDKPVVSPAEDLKAIHDKIKTYLEGLNKQKAIDDSKMREQFITHVGEIVNHFSTAKKSIGNLKSYLTALEGINQYLESYRKSLLGYTGLFNVGLNFIQSVGKNADDEKIPLELPKKIKKILDEANSNKDKAQTNSPITCQAECEVAEIALKYAQFVVFDRKVSFDQRLLNTGMSIYKNTIVKATEKNTNRVRVAIDTFKASLKPKSTALVMPLLSSKTGEAVADQKQLEQEEHEVFSKEKAVIMPAIEKYIAGNQENIQEQKGAQTLKQELDAEKTFDGFNARLFKFMKDNESKKDKTSLPGILKAEITRVIPGVDKASLLFSI